MINFSKQGNYLNIRINFPKFKKNNNIFYCYQITYLRPNGIIQTQMRYDLPRVVNFNEYEEHSVKEYIGCSTGLGWEIKNIRLIECKFRS